MMLVLQREISVCEAKLSSFLSVLQLQHAQVEEVWGERKVASNAVLSDHDPGDFERIR